MGKIRTSRSPAARARAQLLEKYHLRGHRYSNLWLFYSPKTQQDWVATSDLCFDHAIWMEADPQIKCYDLSPPEIITTLTPEPRKAELDAVVQRADGQLEWRRIDSADKADTAPDKHNEKPCYRQAADAAGADYRVVTKAEIWRNEQLIFNWRRVVAFIAAVRDTPMTDARSHAALALRRMREGTLRDLLSEADPIEHAQLLAALFELHQAGHCAMDLDQQELSLATRFWQTEAEAK